MATRRAPGSCRPSHELRYEENARNFRHAFHLLQVPQAVQYAMHALGAQGVFSEAAKFFFDTGVARCRGDIVSSPPDSHQLFAAAHQDGDPRAMLLRLAIEGRRKLRILVYRYLLHQGVQSRAREMRGIVRAQRNSAIHESSGRRARRSLRPPGEGLGMREETPRRTRSGIFHLMNRYMRLRNGADDRARRALVRSRKVRWSEAIGADEGFEW
jgi:hypothetical protein